VDEKGAIELKLHNKTEAVNVLLRSVGGIVERHEHDVGQGLGERLKAAVLRAEQAALEYERAPRDVPETTDDVSEIKNRASKADE
jgi:hypothetical protein